MESRLMNTLLGAPTSKAIKNSNIYKPMIYIQKGTQRTETLFAPQTSVSFH